MIRLVLHSILAVLVFASVTACQREARSKAAGTQAVADEARTSAPNPFGTYGYKSSDVDVRSGVAECVKFHLKADDIIAGEALSGALQVENGCDSAIAVLTQPVEVRVRLSEQQRFPAELVTSAVYTTAYIFSEKAGLPSSSFRGDGGLEVRRVPKYFAVSAHSSAMVPITGGGEFTRELPPGVYGFSLLVPVAIGGLFDPMEAPFNLSWAVKQHNVDASDQPLRMPVTSSRLSAVAHFKVR